ncbi:hypothetical protein NQ318_018451 [Aromia moschata]|uniref:Uncharacterized protein n=1 Tax=Aromia moschata TaxID=1265417 RepID=A0AAV8YLA6_9CUCU|nr:hypothetical protein NQ318_018451 [Aromia moschata]
MNRSWKNNSNNAPGFVYFNVNNSYQNNSSDTSDFLSFGDSPSYGSPNFNRFSPNNYSSPKKYQNSPRQFNNKRNVYRYSSGHNNRSYNSNNSYNSSYNNNTRKRESGRHSRGNTDISGKKNMSMFFDHTSLKDPWAELEENLKESETLRCQKIVLWLTQKRRKRQLWTMKTVLQTRMSKKQNLKVNQVVVALMRKQHNTGLNLLCIKRAVAIFFK